METNTEFIDEWNQPEPKENNTMTNNTATPWKIIYSNEYIEKEYLDKEEIEEIEKNKYVLSIEDCNGKTVVYTEDGYFKMTKAEHIVKCVNSHEKLVEALKEAIEVIQSNGDKLPDMKYFEFILAEVENSKP